MREIHNFVVLWMNVVDIDGLDTLHEIVMSDLFPSPIRQAVPIVPTKLKNGNLV